MHIAQCRTERNHIQLRIHHKEVAAFQAGMQSRAKRSNAIQILVCLNRNLQNLGIHIWGPTRIAVALLHFSTCKLEMCNHFAGDFEFAGFFLAALRSSNHNLVFITVNADKGKVCRSAYHTLDAAAHRYHCVGSGIYAIHNALCSITVDYIFRSVGRFELNKLAVLYTFIFRLDYGRKIVETRAQIFFLVGRHTDYSVCVARNHIAQLASVDVGNSNVAISLIAIVEEAGKQLVGISTSEMNVGTGVSAFKPQQRYGKELVSGRNSRTCIMEFSDSVDTACTSQENLCLVL